MANAIDVYGLCAAVLAQETSKKQGKNIFPVLRTDVKMPKKPEDYLLGDIFMSDEANNSFYSLLVNDNSIGEGITRYISIDSKLRSLAVSIGNRVKYVPKMLLALKSMGAKPPATQFIIVGDNPSTAEMKVEKKEGAELPPKEAIMAMYITASPDQPRRQFPELAFEIQEADHNKEKGYWELTDKSNTGLRGAIAASNSVFRALEEGAEDEFSQIVRRYFWKWVEKR